MLDNTQYQPTKFRTESWIDINDDARGTYNKDSQIRFKTSMLKSSLCDYSDAENLVKRTIIVTSKVTSRVLALAKADNIGEEYCSIYWLHKWNNQYTNR